MKDTTVRAFNEVPAEVAAEGITFDASAESVAQARRMVVSQLEAWALSQITDDARLVVSELLTNAALHAQPPIRMRLARLEAGVRVEVSDGSREMPLMVHAGTDVMTGRGWTLVEALCTDWGVKPLSGGKVVWATLQDSSITAGASTADSRTVDADLLELAGPSRAGDDEVVRYEVVLGDVPTSLLMAAKAHIDALIREFALLASGAATSTSRVPREVTTLIERVVGNFGEARQSIKRQALRASDQHDPRTRLSLNLPLSAADAGLEYLAALDEVDAYCRAEQMLTLESPASHRVFRRWYVEELVAGLRRAAAETGNADLLSEGPPARAAESFEARLLREFEKLSDSTRR